MACVLLVSKEKVKDPKKWFSAEMDIDYQWEKDLGGYQSGSIHFSGIEGFYRFEDFQNDYFTYWGMDSWFSVAGDNEIIYGFYSEDNLSAEYVHIKNGECIREYRSYFDWPEENVDEGDSPEFDDWVAVSMYVDREMC
nr:hypothetical protein [Eubacterium sp.]